MIKKITEAQVSKFKDYRDKWVTKGLSTDRLDKDESRKFVNFLYQDILSRAKPIVVFVGGPIQAWYATLLLNLFQNVKDQVEAQVGDQVRDQVRDQVGYQVRDQVEDQVWDQVEDQVWDQVGDQVRAQVWDQVRDQVGDQVRAQVWDQVRDQVRDQVGDQVRAQVWDQVRDQVEDQVWDQVGSIDFIWPYLDGQFWANFFAYYDFLKDELGVILTDKYLKLRGISEIGNTYPLDKFCIISDRMEICKKTSKGLHCEDGPAVRYRDGFELYALNGVRVTKQIVASPADEIDPKILLKEKNAEVRREIIRKIGIDRVLSGLQARTLDTMGLYDLLDLDLGDGRVRPYLKMLNPSTGTWHIEGVAPECQTVQQALAWRNGVNTYVEPEILT